MSVGLSCCIELIDAYLFIKRFIAHGTDGEITEEEWARIVEDLVDDTRHLAMDDTHWEGVLRQNKAVYEALMAQGHSAVLGHFRRCVKALAPVVQANQEMRERLIDQLWALAEADGVVDWMENHFIEETERVWGMQASRAETH